MQPLTVQQLIRILRAMPKDSLVFVLDAGEGCGIQVTTPDGEEEVEFIDLPE